MTRLCSWVWQKKKPETLCPGLNLLLTCIGCHRHKAQMRAPIAIAMPMVTQIFNQMGQLTVLGFLPMNIRTKSFSPTAAIPMIQTHIASINPNICCLLSSNLKAASFVV